MVIHFEFDFQFEELSVSLCLKYFWGNFPLIRCRDSLSVDNLFVQIYETLISYF